ncbi:transposase [Corynebacterium pseudodiphtheriticum]|nr:transposase [Corynebacterium pseudodiphtheriticum]MDK4305069.1 transposase [Corynebacterium pseudodiphtheriticum]
MSQQRKKYTPEYRREAANLVIESERPIAHVAKEIGVAPGLLGWWVKMSANAEDPPMGQASRIFVLRMLVCAVSWQKPRWIMSFCQTRQLSSL